MVLILCFLYNESVSVNKFIHWYNNNATLARAKKHSGFMGRFQTFQQEPLLGIHT